jgi:ribosome-associated protein
MKESQALDSETLMQKIVQLVREKRGEDVVALDVRGVVDYMDFLVLATARSERQNRAIAEHAVRSLKREGERALSNAGAEAGTWICVDFVDVVLHLFTPETRQHYDLELLWADADRVDVPEEDRASRSSA